MGNFRQGSEYMRAIVFGSLGSMGRRRIRCLRKLGYSDISGFDLVDMTAVKDSFCWYTDEIDEIESLMAIPENRGEKIDAVFVCTPPMTKQPYIDLANKYGIPCFVETDICNYTGEYSMSNSTIFHPAVQKIKELLDDGVIGNPCAFQYHCGQSIYTWRNGNTDIWQAKKETGGCRELLPFEIGWLSYLFGEPIEAKGMMNKRLDDKNITADDVCSCAVRFWNKAMTVTCVPVNNSVLYGALNSNTVTGNILIDLISCPAVRQLKIVGTKGTLMWDWENDFVTIAPMEKYGLSLHDMLHGMNIKFDKGKSAEGYNENIPELMYERELANFIASVQGKEKYLYTKAMEEASIRVLEGINAD